MKNRQVLALILIVQVLLIAGCFGNDSSKPKVIQPNKPKPGLEVAPEPTRERPISVNKSKNEIRIYTELNGASLTTSTRHAIVYKEGTEASKALFLSYAKPMQLYDALRTLRARPGNTLKMDSEKRTPVTGEVLKVKVWFESMGYDLESLIKQEPAPGAVVLDWNADEAEWKAAFNVCFGGNGKQAKESDTGEILCLDSCPVSITSNDSWGYGDWEAGLIEFYPQAEKLPPSGSPVIVSFIKQY
ncbi:MAG: YdjY domain-containing protein [Candidatus Aquicultorales bacterium]